MYGNSGIAGFRGFFLERGLVSRRELSACPDLKRNVGFGLGEN